MDSFNSLKSTLIVLVRLRWAYNLAAVRHKYLNGRDVIRIRVIEDIVVDVYSGIL